MVDKLQHQEDPQFHALEVIVSAKFLLKRAFVPRFLWRFFGISSSSPELRDAKAELYAFLKVLANQRRDEIADGRSGQEKWEMDVLQRLLLGHDMSEDEIFGELLGFFVAGTFEFHISFFTLDYFLSRP